MADGSRYLKCDGCSAVIDRRSAADWKDGGTFRYGTEQELFEYAKSLGWTWTDDGRGDKAKHFCPACSHGQLRQEPQK